VSSCSGNDDDSFLMLMIDERAKFYALWL